MIVQEDWLGAQTRTKKTNKHPVIVIEGHRGTRPTHHGWKKSRKSKPPLREKQGIASRERGERKKRELIGEAHQ